MYFKSLPESKVPSFKEKYLSVGGNNVTYPDEDTKAKLQNLEIPLIGVRKEFKNISKQVLEDYIKVVTVFNDQAVINSIQSVSDFLKIFWQENYNQYIALLQADLSMRLAPDIVFRLISLNQIKYGNRADIEIALVSSLIGFRPTCQYSSQEIS